MAREMMNLEMAARHVHVDANELKHVAQRGEIPAEERHGVWWFDHRDLDEWAQRNILGFNAKELDAHHEALEQERAKSHATRLRVVDYFRTDAVSLELAAKAKGGLIRDMTDLATASGLVYDDEGLFKELAAREDAAPTAIGMGCAFLHPRYHDPYFFSESFIAYGRSLRPIFFGAPDGGGTRHFFLICSTNHEEHLHLLARLAVLAHGTDLLERLDTAEDAAGVIAAVEAAETEYLAS